MGYALIYFYRFFTAALYSVRSWTLPSAFEHSSKQPALVENNANC